MLDVRSLKSDVSKSQNLKISKSYSLILLFSIISALTVMAT